MLQFSITYIYSIKKCELNETLVFACYTFQEMFEVQPLININFILVI